MPVLIVLDPDMSQVLDQPRILRVQPRGDELLVDLSKGDSNDLMTVEQRQCLFAHLATTLANGAAMVARPRHVDTTPFNGRNEGAGIGEEELVHHLSYLRR